MAFLGSFNTKGETPGSQVGKGLVTGLAGALEGLTNSKIKEIERQRIAQGLQGVGYSPEEAKGLANLPPELQKTVLGTKAIQSKEEAKAQQIGAKESSKFYQTLSKESQGAKENNLRLNKMKELIQSGKLTSPTFAAALKSLNKGIFGFGIDLSGLLNKESQQFDKLSADFVRGAKDVFGGQRLTDNDINLFLKTVPSLTQSNEGKMAIINHLESLNRAVEVKKQTADAIIRANGGRPPANLDFIVDQIAGPELDRLAKEFIGKKTEEVAGTQTLPGALARAVPNLLLGSS